MNAIILPHDDEAEQYALGAALWADEAADILIDALTTEDFFRDSHRLLFSTIASLRAKGQSADGITVSMTLRDAGNLDGAGGPAYVVGLVDLVPGPSNVRAYVKRVKETSLERRLLIAGNEIMTIARDGEGEFGEKYAKALGLLYALEATDQGGFKPLQPAVREYWDKVSQARDGDRQLVGLPTPFPRLNELSGGLRPGVLTVLGGDPGEGKTMLAVQIIEHVIKESPESGVAVFTLEMLDHQYAGRLLTSMTKYDSRTLERHRTHSKAVGDEEWKWCFERSEELGKKRVWIDDSFPYFEQCRARLFRLCRRERIDLVVADYVQLISSEANFETEAAEMNTIAVQFSELAKTLPCHVILISQLRRPATASKRPKPSYRDFKSSSGLEQASGLGLLIWRPDGGERADLIVCKNRFGRAGEVELHWDVEKGLFSGGLDWWTEKAEKGKAQEPDAFAFTDA